MILSSADILRILGGSEIIRLSAKLSIADGKPSLSGAEGLFIYVNRFPSVDEFEATWTIWVESDGSEPDDLVLAEIAKLLPAVKVVSGLLTTVTTTDFLSTSTQRAPEGPRAKAVQVDLAQYEERFQGLMEDVQDQMLLVSSGRPGKDGKDGQSGQDGRDGKDIDATQTELFDLKDVDESPLPLEKGQVLTWDGSKWTNLYIRTVTSIGGGGGGNGGGSGGDGTSGTGGIEEAPLDGNYYVRSEGKWLNMVDVLDGLGYMRSDVLDGGDFTNVITDATDDAVVDGGDFT